MKPSVKFAMALISPSSLPLPPSLPHHTVITPSRVTMAQLISFVTGKQGSITVDKPIDYQIAINGFQHLMNTQITEDILDDLTQRGETIILESVTPNNWQLEKGTVVSRSNPQTHKTEYFLNPQGIRINLLLHNILVPDKYQPPTVSKPTTKVIVSSTGTKIVSANQTAPQRAATTVVAQRNVRRDIGEALRAYTTQRRPAGPPVLENMLADGGYDPRPRMPQSADYGRKALLSRGGTAGNVWEGTLHAHPKLAYAPAPNSSFVLKVNTPGPLHGQDIVIQGNEALYFARDN